MKTRPPVARHLAVAAGLAAMVTACELPFGSENPAETQSAMVQEEVADEPPVVTAAESPTASSEEGAADESAEEPATTTAPVQVEEAREAAPSAPEEALATVAGSEPFVELEVLDLRRDGDAVTLVFSILVGEDDGFISTSWVFASGPDQFRMATDEGAAGPNDPRRKAMSGVTLVDRTNANRHLVLRDSEGHCLCTRFEEAEPGQRYIHSAQFPAPPEGVDSMTVEVPLFPSIDNVPIREAS